MKIQSYYPTQQTPDAKLKEQDAQLREAAKMYENHFLNEMVKAMRSTVNREEGMMKPNFAEKIFSEQLDQKYVDGWTEKGGVGLADMIYNQIREKYLATVKKDFSRPAGPLPMAPRKDMGGLQPNDSIQMKTLPAGAGAQLEFRFEVQNPSGSGGGFDAVNPMGGVIKQARGLAEGWNSVRLDHGQGLESEVTFPGTVPDFGLGTRLEAGQKLGQLDPSRPVLSWKLDWT